MEVYCVHCKMSVMLFPSFSPIPTRNRTDGKLIKTYTKWFYNIAHLVFSTFMVNPFLTHLHTVTSYICMTCMLQSDVWDSVSFIKYRQSINIRPKSKNTNSCFIHRPKLCRPGHTDCCEVRQIFNYFRKTLFDIAKKERI